MRLPGTHLNLTFGYTPIRNIRQCRLPIFQPKNHLLEILELRPKTTSITETNEARLKNPLNKRPFLKNGSCRRLPANQPAFSAPHLLSPLSLKRGKTSSE
jgi:hypothetical protein